MLALAGDGGADGTRGSGPSETISQAMRVGCRVAACTLTSIYPHIVEMPSEVSCAPSPLRTACSAETTTR